MFRRWFAALWAIRTRILMVSATLAALLWSDWPAARGMVERWSNDPRYSHGFLVPLFAIYLLWRRRGLCPEPSARPHLAGLVVVAIGSAVQLGGAITYFGWFEGLALVVSLGGLVVLWGGVAAIRWAGPSLAFLLFMLPLPYRAEVALGGPLQRIGTLASTYTLQTLGLPAVAEGNIIRMDDRASIAVVEACNGLGMLAAFAAYATATAMVIENRSPLTRLLLLLSAAPLAILANVTRITATGLAHATLGGGAADLVFHDLAGWLMMPLALGLLWGELALVAALVVPISPDATMAMAVRRSLAPPAGRPAS